MRLINNSKYISKIITMVMCIVFLSLSALGSSVIVFGNETEQGTEQENNYKTEQNTYEVVNVTDIELGDYNEKMKVGDYQSLTAAIVPADATNAVITYRSSDASVVKVNSAGEVKGIAKGKAVIYVSAGDVIKEIPIDVIVGTTGININSTYVVLKSGESYKLTAAAVPEGASQDITYKVVDKNIADVSKAGIINAHNVGDTTVLVSNGDYQTAVTVIVNAGSGTGEDKEAGKEQHKQEIEYDYEVNAYDNETISTERLYNLYYAKKALSIKGNGYEIVIDGKNIVNYNNEFFTDINLKKEENGATFVINQNEPLCGNITISFDEEYGKYLYLYNESKGKYELLNDNGKQALTISTSGKYMIIDRRVSVGTGWIIYVLSAGTVIMAAGGVAYIIVKKRYWFW